MLVRILAGFLWSILVFMTIRMTNNQIISYLLNKNAEKKRKKGMTLKERFHYTRFRNELPKVFIILYYGYMIFTLIYTLILLVFVFFNVSADLIISMLRVKIFFFDFILMTFLFFGFNKDEKIEKRVNRKDYKKEKRKMNRQIRNNGGIWTEDKDK